MKINLITGGSGFVGGYLVKRLLELGENVWVVIRPLEGVSVNERSIKLFSKHFKGYPNTFRVVEGNIMEENLGIGDYHLQELLQGEVFLWHLAANLSFATKNKDNVRRTNYIGTTNVVNLANKIADRYLHMSTVYICGNARSVFHESDLEVGQEFRNHYESSKFEAEKYVRKSCNIPHLIFRPSIIMGDAYKGKAEGCTFGYYRFAFMFFVFKKWLIKKIKTENFFSLLLRAIGTKYDKATDELVAPWLFLLHPRGGSVNMVAVDYVIDSMITANKSVDPQLETTLHLVQQNPPKFEFLLRSLLEDFGFREVKYIQVPTFVFKGLLRLFYYLVYPIRGYTKSVFWYLPYFTHKRRFDCPQTLAPEITRSFVQKINAYAQQEIFKNIDTEKPL